MEVINAVKTDCARLCNRHFGAEVAPEVQVIAPKDTRSFPFIPQYLYYMLFELMKNSMRACVEAGRGEGDPKPASGKNPVPPIRVTVSGDKDLVAIKVRIL